MSNRRDLDVTWGREFCEALGGKAGVCSTQDGYEAWVVAFGRQTFDIGFMRQLTADQLRQLRDAARQIFEIANIETVDMQKAIEATIWHFSDNEN